MREISEIQQEKMISPPSHFAKSFADLSLSAIYNGLQTEETLKTHCIHVV